MPEPDFIHAAMREFEGSAAEAKYEANQILLKAQQLRDQGKLEVRPSEIDIFHYEVNMLDQMVGRLKALVNKSRG